MKWATRNAYEIDRILEYLRVNGPSYTRTMRADGVDIPPGLMARLHQDGIVEVVKGPRTGTRLWRLVE